MPVFALCYGRLQSSRKIALAQARTHAAALANQAADAHLDMIVKAKHVLEMVAASPSLRGTVAECDEFLGWVKRLIADQKIAPWMTGVFVVNPAGNVKCGTFPNAKSINLRDRSYFSKMLDSKEFVTSEIIVGRLSQRLIIATALPIFDASGRLEMVIALGADLQQLNAIGTEAHTKFGGGLAVLNSHGNASAVLPEAENSNPSHAFSEPSIIHAILAANAPTIEAVDRTGTSRIYGVEQLPQGQRIAVALNRDEVLMPVERSFRSDLLFLLLVAAGSIAAALIVAEFGVLRGVRLLKGAALRLKAGKMGVRVKLPPQVAAELDDLAVTYNAMTAEFERLAYLDRLTGLPNRRYLERQLNDQKLLAGDMRHAVFAIDLDGFKPVNDTYGHAVGDRVLTAVGRRIAMVIDERGLLARVGGDEFVAIIPLPQTEHREFARSLAEEILVAMDAPLDLDGFPFPVGCSVGIAMVPDDAATLGGALIRADAALYKAKRSGRNRVIDNAPPLAAEMIAEDGGKQPHWTPIESPEAS